MIIIYISPRMHLSYKGILVAHLCHLPSAFQQMWSRLSLPNIIILAVRQGHLHSAKGNHKKKEKRSTGTHKMFAHTRTHTGK